MASGSDGQAEGWGPSDADPVDRDHDSDYADLAAELRDQIHGDVRFDEYSRVLYATDGSIYDWRPAGVVYPTSVADVRAAHRIAADHEVPVVPRGAGSSLAGQTTGKEAVVLDLSRHLTDIRAVEPGARRVTVQPGVVLDDLNAALDDHGLKFAPDPASANRATIGGMIGNNSTGAHSVRYGITQDYVESVTVVLADGSVIETGPIPLDGPAWQEKTSGDSLEAALYRTTRRVIEETAAEIERRYPDLNRVVSGYNLDAVLDTDPEGARVIDLTELFVGAEGTLGTVVSATLDLVSKPDETALALYCFDDLLDAMRAVPQALEHDVSAVELMDERVFELAAESAKYAEYVEALPEGTRAALMLEYDDELVNDFEAAVGRTDDRFLVAGAAFDRIEALDADAQADLWSLRKAAIPLLMSLPGDPKPYPFIEDATVPPAELATYVSGFEEILEAHDTSAAYFAHAGSGTLHIRPILNLKTESGVETMHSIADAVTDLVLEHHGSFSGEHGDGLARTQFNPKMYGEDLWAGFKAIKEAADPDWRMNPGVVVYRDGYPTDMRDHLRYGPAYSSIEPTTVQSFEAEGGFSHLIELCNGCGTCRQTESEVMCPTYRATEEEIQSTRGRANMLRAAISGDIPPDQLYTDRFTGDVLDVCLGCKGCMSDCPTGVDLAKLKVEVTHEYHQREGIGPRERLFARFDELARLGAATAPLSNWLADNPAIRSLAEKWLGIAADRTLPTFTRATLARWDANRTPAVTAHEADREVLLVPDSMSKYADPGPARAAVEVLEAAGCRVEVATDVGSSGRPAYSNGLLDRAVDQATAFVDRLAPAVRSGWDIVFIEPSDAVMVQDEYGDLVAQDGRVGRIAANTYELMEYVDQHRLDERIDWGGAEGSLTYHGHCHQKAIGTDHHAPRVLERAGFTVDDLDSSCCGMAGTFGYKAEQYELSMAVGAVLFDQVAASPGETVTSPGTSCRDQLIESSAVDGRPSHPIEILAASR